MHTRQGSLLDSLRAVTRAGVVFWGIAAPVALALGAGLVILFESDAVRSWSLPGPAWGSLLAIVLALAVLLRIGLRVRGVLGALFVVLSAYLALGYVARPLVLLWVEPAVGKNDPLADVRLARAGYAEALGAILPIVATGIVTFVITAWLFCRHRIGQERASSRGTVRAGHAFVLYGLGWAFRIVQQTVGATTLLETGAVIASVAAGVYLLYGPRLRTVPVIGLVVGELAWSAWDASKTPILALLLWLLIRLFADGRRLNLRIVLGGALAGLAAFQAITLVKVRVGTLSGTDMVRERYPEAVQPFFAILARFDALQSSTDSYYAGPGSWLAPGEAVTQALRSLLPRQVLGDKAALAGDAWGREVRTLSLPGDPGASLAQGPTAEGWVLGGYTGVLVEVLVMLALTILVARWLQSSKLFLMLLGVAMTSQPFLFERAVLGSFEGLGKGLQVTLVGLLVMGLLGEFDRRRSRVTPARGGPPNSTQHGTQSFARSTAPTAPAR
ncbi:hypothetical protein [Nocardioides sp. Arc9.136]|uniref:hypothetical protein n=1 Tax=Nocardioides sp. Arc9.136 TaxID=2996826 RepID=UPI002665126F|nr:hypothetical protein [Nocardioides sp. Arc9.136]WKN48028.1 hypothetical protein OSR43_18560 [Nocardioides sp. Arc9.136]